MTTNTGGPAFPCEREHGPKLDSAEGMTLRDYFAAKAMHAEIMLDGEGGNMGNTAQTIAENAYFLADAMLKARG